MVAVAVYFGFARKPRAATVLTVTSTNTIGIHSRRRKILQYSRNSILLDLLVTCHGWHSHRRERGSESGQQTGGGSWRARNRNPLRQPQRNGLLDHQSMERRNWNEVTGGVPQCPVPDKPRSNEALVPSCNI